MPDAADGRIRSSHHVLTADSLALATVEPLLVGRLGRPYTYVESCDSTQLLLSADAPQGAVAVANEQTAGRGRYGRSWEAPAGTSLLCSILLRPPVERSAAELTLVAAVAATRTVEVATGLAAQIKWPNDVMLDRRKVAGVLGEMRGGAVVLGVGVNVNQSAADLPRDVRVAAGSLHSITGTVYDRAALLAALLHELEQAYDRWRVDGLGSLFEEIGPRDFLRGRVVTVDGTSGHALGITREGALAVEMSGGERVSVSSGEVEYDR